MKNIQTLHDLRPGQKAVVRELRLGGPLRRRLRDIGLIEGAVVECVGVSPGGDPAAYLVCGAVIALRTEDSRRIMI